MVCSRGESLTLHIKQMKLLNAIAAAAVIGASFIAPNPAEARNGWVIIGENNGELHHEKFESYAQNRFANVQVATKPGQRPKTIDCINLTYTFKNDGTGWRDIYPGTLGDSSAKRWCR